MEKVWLQSYEEGVKAEIDLSQYQSIAEVIDESINKFRDRTAYVCMGKELSFDELDTLSKNMASYFRNTMGLNKGDRVAIMLPNVLQYPIVLFGILRAGLVAVNVNPLYTAHELEHVLNDSGARALVVLENFAATYEKAKAKAKVDQVLITGLGDFLGGFKGGLVNFVVKHVKKMVPKYNLPEALRLKEALDQGAKAPFELPKDITQEDLAFLQYTGGTTGRSKGAMLSHGNMLANILQASAWINSFISQKLEGGIITALPLYHIFSLTANCMVFMRVGIPNILITNPRDIPGFIKELNKNPFSVMTGVNTLFNALLNHPDFAKIDFSKFKMTLGGGMAVQKAVAERWKKVTGVPLIEAYGLTEASPAVTINPMTLKDYNGSIGLPLPSTDIKICDDEGNEQPLGEPGELWCKGPQVMKGYWNDDEKTSSVLTDDGWLKTGDVATVDEKGFVRIVDRKKDMILVSGFNVYPNEVEDVIAHLDGVQEVAVVGVDAGPRGEIVKAFVVKKPDANIDKDAIIAHCKEQLTNYKIPKEVEFKDELPKTNVGKVLRRALRDN